MSWWDITYRDPFAVCAAADELAEKNTKESLEGIKSSFGSLTEQQRDDLTWAARWDAAGAYIMAGMTYRLVHEHRKLWFVTVALVGLNTLLSLVIISLALGG
jgi:hypothetical protein